MGMLVLILGLVVFLGVHSVRIVAEDWRSQTIAQRGETTWKGGYSLLSAVGLGLIIWGYGLARQQPVVLWVPPVATRHIAALLTLFAFVMLVAAYVPRNAVKARLRHPMILGVKVWAFAHLLSNGNLADVVLFGAFLAWAVPDFIAARRRDRTARTPVSASSGVGTAITLVVGAVAWATFSIWLHGPLIGVRPFG